MKTKDFEVNVGGGSFRITKGDPTYGSVYVDFVVRDGKGNMVAIPIATIESPTDSVTDTSATDAKAVSVYVYGDVSSDDFTDKIVIPRKDIYARAAEEDVVVA